MSHGTLEVFVSYSNGKSHFIDRKTRHFQLSKKNLSGYITSLLRKWCRKDSMAVVIGYSAKIDSLKETALTAEESTWSCAKDLKKCTLDGDAKTVVCFSSLAKGISNAALEWHQQQDISVVLVVLGNNIDEQAFSLLRPSFCERSLVLCLHCTTAFLLDISQFSKGLIDQTETESNTPLSVRRQYDESELIEDAENYKREEIRELITAYENSRYTIIDNDFLSGFRFYSEAFDEVFREFRKILTSEQGDPERRREQAVACRKHASELLFKLSNLYSPHRLPRHQWRNFDRLQCLGSFMSLQYASFSVWFNPNSLMCYNKIIEICRAAINRLEVTKNSFDSNQNEARNCLMNELIKEDRLHVPGEYFLGPNEEYTCRINLLREIELIVKAEAKVYF